MTTRHTYAEMSIVWKLRLYTLLEWMNIVLNECSSTIQDNIGTTGLISELQLELTMILRVRIKCHRLCYVISR